MFPRMKVKNFSKHAKAIEELLPEPWKMLDHYLHVEGVHGLTGVRPFTTVPGGYLLYHHLFNHGGENFIALHRVAVAPMFQGQGLAKGLMAAVGEDALAAKAHWIRAMVPETNLAAQCLFRRCGFVVKRIEKEFYAPDVDGIRRDAYYMEKPVG